MSFTTGSLTYFAVVVVLWLIGGGLEYLAGRVGSTSDVYMVAYAIAAVLTVLGLVIGGLSFGNGESPILLLLFGGLACALLLLVAVFDVLSNARTRR